MTWVEARGGDPAKLTKDDLREFVAYAAHLGLKDCYDSDVDYIASKMSPVENDGRSSQKLAYGWLKRDDRVVCRALRFDASCECVAGPSATPQKFPDGVVIVQVEGKLRGIQPEVFLRTYLRPDRQNFAGLTDIAVLS